MNWFESIIYGFIMSFSEFIPISSHAQGHMLQQIFGTDSHDYLRDLLVHLFALAAFFVAWKKPTELFQFNIRAFPNYRNRRGSRGVKQNRDSRFVRAAIIPMLLVMILSFYFWGSPGTISIVILLIINGIIMYLPERMLHGNKNAAAMSSMDAWLIGSVSAISVIPGFSRMGLGIAIAQMRGADRKHALNWVYLLSIPALLLLVGSDLINLTFGSQLLVLSANFWGYLLLSISAFAGSFLSVYFMRNIVLHHGLCAFSYYSWGAALFMFILYLL